jgi:hypothetical protein
MPATKPSRAERLDPAVREAVGRIPRIEWLFCGWLITRQLAAGGRRVKERQRYGPRGWVDICRARAIQVYIVGVVVIGVVLRIAHVPSILGPALIILLLLFVAEVFRLVVAGREGRRWRSQHPEDLSADSA